LLPPVSFGGKQRGSPNEEKDPLSPLKKEKRFAHRQTERGKRDMPTLLRTSSRGRRHRDRKFQTPRRKERKEGIGITVRPVTRMKGRTCEIGFGSDGLRERRREPIRLRTPKGWTPQSSEKDQEEREKSSGNRACMERPHDRGGEDMFDEREMRSFFPDRATPFPEKGLLAFILEGIEPREREENEGHRQGYCLRSILREKGKGLRLPPRRR